jgi:hypothetical protein
MTYSGNLEYLWLALILEFGLPARSRFGEGRCLEFGDLRLEGKHRRKLPDIRNILI